MSFLQGFIDDAYIKLGYAPSTDLDARSRCYAYLSDTIQKIDEKKSENPIESVNSDGSFTGLNNISSILNSTQHLLIKSSSSSSLKDSNNFWKQWDKIKKDTIISNLSLSGKNQNDSELVSDQLNILESGRHY